MAANWKFIFNRRGIKLVDYVADCETVEDAISKFEKAGIESPTVDEIVAAMGPRSKVQDKVPTKKSVPRQSPKKTAQTPKRADKKKPADKRLVDSPRKVDDLVVL